MSSANLKNEIMEKINKLIEELKSDIEFTNFYGHNSEEIEDALITLEKLKEAINYTHCCESDSEQLVCNQNELDCPYDFTSRCTMGRCDCKPKAN